MVRISFDSTFITLFSTLHISALRQEKRVIAKAVRMIWVGLDCAFVVCLRTVLVSALVQEKRVIAKVVGVGRGVFNGAFIIRFGIVATSMQL